MSAESVEIAKQAVDAVNRRDVDAFMETVTGDYEHSSAMGPIEVEIFREREGIETYFERLGDNLFTWRSPPSTQLLVQAAIVQIYALLSSPPRSYF
jgi:hypothetical protein